MENKIFSNIGIALNHIDNVYNDIKYLIDNELSLDTENREKLYFYGLDKAKINLVRIINVKKALNTIMENKKFAS